MDPTHPPETVSPPEGQPTRAGFPFLLLWLPFLLLVVYPLSTGPAALLDIKFPAARPVLRALYYPMILLAEHSPATERALAWYLKLWGIPII